MVSLDDKSVYDHIFWSHVVENVWVYSLQADLQAGLWCSIGKGNIIAVAQPVHYNHP